MRFGFDGFVVDPDGYRLLRSGEEVILERRTFDLLLYLVENRGRVISKQELLERVWGARMLSDGALSNAVAKLRRALDQAPDSKRPIETVHGRGYRFTAELDDANAPPQSPNDPFVGRQATLQALLARLEQKQRGSESLVILSGEAGVGKTRTARELAARARQRGVSVWVGAAYEGAGAPAYWPWIQVLRAAREDLPDALWQASLPRGAWAIAQLVPELELGGNAPLSVEPQTARFALFDEVTRFLKAVCAVRPLLVIIDDLHWADLGTIELLGFAARALEQLPAMLLATLRTGDLPPHHDESSPLQQLTRIATFISLQGLSAEEVFELAVAVTGQPMLDAGLARALHGRTQGNALFVRQTLELVLQKGDWSCVEHVSPAAELPPAIRHVIRRRLAALPEPTQRLLEAAAVIGNDFDLAVLSAVVESRPETVLDVLEPALRLGVVQQQHAERPQELRFAHVLTKESLYEELGARRRGELHGRVALVLSQRHGRARSRRLAEVAEHFLCAVPFDVDAAAEACRAAAGAAQQASGFEAAADLLSRAIAKIDAEGGDPETRCRLLLELGEDRFYAGRITLAWNAFRDAAATIRNHESVEMLAEIAPRLADCLELGLGEEHFAKSVIEECLARLPETAHALRASTLAQHAELALELPVAQRFALLDEAAALAERSGAPEAMLEVAHSRAILRCPTELAKNARSAERFLRLAEQYPEAAASMRYRTLRRFGAHLTRYLSCLTACDLEGADVALEQCRQIADASHVSAARFGVGLMQVGRALGDGRLSDVERILSAHNPQGAVERAAWSSCVLALCSARNNADALSGLRFDDELMLRNATFRHAPYVAIGSAELFMATGRASRARATLAQVPAGFLARMPAQYGDFGMLCSLVEICRLEHDRGRAERLFEILKPHAALNAVYPTFEYRGSIAHYLGILLRMLGRESNAREHFQHALEVNRKLGMPLRSAATERELERSMLESP